MSVRLNISRVSVLYRLFSILCNRITLLLGLIVCSSAALFFAYIVYVRCDHFGCIPSWLYDPEKCFEPTLPSGLTPFFYLLFDAWHQHCVKHGITYIPLAGTMLGIYRNGGKIPWDDDIDFLVPWNQQAKLAKTMVDSNTSSTVALAWYSLYNNSVPYWRAYLRHHNFAKMARFGWYFTDYTYGYYPYIDVFLYKENNTHIWAIDKKYPYYVFRKSDVFPLKLTPFDHLHTMAPRKSRWKALLRQTRIDWRMCENSPHYKVTPQRKSYCHNVMISCKRLEKYFDFLPGTID